ncbi:unnamed protein product [Menidia menidia]|uniref:Sodium channel regulatory subunit beta-3 n=1 Tax=Menidia menidia TaxID=238744 RepID=A0A8S4ADT8_9TELE|nr:unnamed protein product [Menidia menidia]
MVPVGPRLVSGWFWVPTRTWDRPEPAETGRNQQVPAGSRFQTVLAGSGRFQTHERAAEHAAVRPAVRQADVQQKHRARLDVPVRGPAPPQAPVKVPVQDAGLRVLVYLQVLVLVYLQVQVLLQVLVYLPVLVLMQVLVLDLLLVLLSPGALAGCAEVDSLREAVVGQDFLLGCISCKSREEVPARAAVDWFYRPPGGGGAFRHIFHYDHPESSVLDGDFDGRLRWRGTPDRDVQTGAVLLLNVSLSDGGTYRCVFSRTLVLPPDNQHLVVPLMSRTVSSVVSDTILMPVSTRRVG